VKQFEEIVADYLGVRYAAAVSSGTAALHAAYKSLNIETGDFIITAPITFAATSNAAVYLGARPLYADVDPSTGLISTASIRTLLESKFGPKVKAIVAIDFAGMPCNYDEIEQLAAEFGTELIIDAAHSLGSRYGSRKGAFAGGLSILSFHPVKSITCGEGGMVLTNSESLYEKICLFRAHGIQKTSALLHRPEGPWSYEMEDLGYNYRLSEMQAALGASQMNSIEGFISRRREIAAFYREKLEGNRYFECLVEPNYGRSALHLFPILIKKKPFAECRRFVFEALVAENIGVQVHYIPTYRMPYYSGLLPDDWAQKCPNAEEFYSREISLPIFPAMSDQDANDVIDALSKISLWLEKSTL
jgi:dTDP-4-amino-4,6-dideoxygalactose transaminase